MLKKRPEKLLTLARFSCACFFTAPEVRCCIYMTKQCMTKAVCSGFLIGWSRDHHHGFRSPRF